MGAERPTCRLWLVFFSDPVGTHWWARFFKRGYRHVSAACWYDLEQRWVYFNPARNGINIQLFSGEQGWELFGQLMTTSTIALRVRSEFDRRNTPAAWYCVGAIKALLGIRSRALSPFQLRDHLLQRGAELVPPLEDERGSDLQRDLWRGR